MAWTEQRLDPDRSRRRLQILAGAKSLREREHPRRVRVDRLRELIAIRRRLVN